MELKNRSGYKFPLWGQNKLQISAVCILTISAKTSVQKILAHRIFLGVEKVTQYGCALQIF